MGNCIASRNVLPDRYLEAALVEITKMGMRVQDLRVLIDADLKVLQDVLRVYYKNSDANIATINGKVNVSEAPFLATEYQQRRCSFPIARHAESYTPETKMLPFIEPERTLIKSWLDGASSLM